MKLFLVIVIVIVILKIDTLGTIENQQRNLKNIEKQLENIEKQLENIEKQLETWNVGYFEVTAYAPLDPNAVEGMCFQGDRNVTASGKQVVIGETVAAGSQFPFGARVYIEGFGWRTVTDRGGRITNRHFDVAVATQEEAIQWGRQRVRVIYERSSK